MAKFGQNGIVAHHKKAAKKVPKDLYLGTGVKKKGGKGIGLPYM